MSSAKPTSRSAATYSRPASSRTPISAEEATVSGGVGPNTLSKAYTEAGYFARNVRTIEVLIDRDAVAAGAPGDGQPWQHYDLGHG